MKAQATIALPLKSSSDQRELKEKEIKRQMQIKAEICQNRPAGKNQFFRRPSVPKIEKC